MVRVIWWAALAVGVSYMLPVLIDWRGPGITAWKGASIALLALWAGLQARTFDGWLMTTVLAIGAVGDVVLNIHGLRAGAVFFVAAHVVAIILYARNRRLALTGSQRALAWLLPPLAMLIVYGMTREFTAWPVAVGYAMTVSVMAAVAWTSRFPRYRTGVGTMLFVLSDLAIFAGQVELLPPDLRRLTVWPTYFAAQALIAWGVVTTLRSDGPLTLESASR
jgi:uncharacterized membrane protein YhhN